MVRYLSPDCATTVQSLHITSASQSVSNPSMLQGNDSQGGWHKTPSRSYLNISISFSRALRQNCSLCRMSMAARMRLLETGRGSRLRIWNPRIQCTVKSSMKDPIPTNAYTVTGHSGSAHRVALRIFRHNRCLSVFISYLSTEKTTTRCLFTSRRWAPKLLPSLNIPFIDFLGSLSHPLPFPRTNGLEVRRQWGTTAVC